MEINDLTFVSPHKATMQATLTTQKVFLISTSFEKEAFKGCEYIKIGFLGDDKTYIYFVTSDANDDNGFKTHKSGTKTRVQVASFFDLYYKDLKKSIKFKAEKIDDFIFKLTPLNE